MHYLNYIWLFLCLMVIPDHAFGRFPERTQAIDSNMAGDSKVVARVNGRPIFAEQVKPEVENSLQKFRKYGMRKEDPNFVERLWKRVLDRLIDQELLYQESRKVMIEDIDPKVEQKLKTLERKYGQGKRLETHLKTRNLTVENVRAMFKTRIRVDEYLKQQGILEPEIPEERVKRIYEDNPHRYSREESVNVSHILIAVDVNAGSEGRERARQKVEQIRKDILAGQDFAEMARRYSDCQSASGGGRLEYIKRGYMPKEFDNVAFAIKKDDISGIVETRFGYHIIKVFEKRPAGRIPYEEVKNFITKYLQEEESKKKLATHIVELKSRAKIELVFTE